MNTARCQSYVESNKIDPRKLRVECYFQEDEEKEGARGRRNVWSVDTEL